MIIRVFATLLVAGNGETYRSYVDVSEALNSSSALYSVARADGLYMLAIHRLHMLFHWTCLLMTPFSGTDGLVVALRGNSLWLRRAMAWTSSRQEYLRPDS